MITLRILGIVIALLAVGYTFRLFNQGRLRRLDLFIAWIVAAAVIGLGTYPDIFAPVFDVLNFAEGDNRRLLGVLVISNVVLFLLYLRAMALVDTTHRDLNRLVRALGQREFEGEGHPELKDADIAVIIPAYNEAATIEEVLKGMPKEVAGLHVVAVVVDDGAQDDTEAIAREHGAVAAHAINRGQGAGLLTGHARAGRGGA